MRPPIEFVDDLDAKPVTAKAGGWTVRRVIKWIVVATVVLFAGGYLLLVYRYYAHDVQIKRNYAAELNEPILKIPEEKRAWTHYRRALLVLEPLPSDLEGFGMIATSPDDETWAVTVEYLRQNGKGLALIRRAAAIRPFGELHRDEYDPADFPWLIRHGALTLLEAESPPTASENPPLLNLKRASSECVMRLARLLAADARLAAMEDDSDRAVEDIFALCGMSEQRFDQTMLMDQTVGFTLLSIAIDACGAILAEHLASFSDEQLSKLSDRLTKSPQTGPIKIRFDGERKFFADIVQRVFTDDGNGDGIMRPDRMADLDTAGDFAAPAIKWTVPFAMRFFAGRREVSEKFDELVARIEVSAAQPLWLRFENVDDSASEEIEKNGARYFLLAIFLPAGEAFNRNAENLTQQRDAIRAAIALVRHHSRHGQWPKSLDALRSNLLNELPVDRFDGKPLRYRPIDGQPVLYSVGKNLRDDGGVPPSGDDGNHAAAEGPPDPSLKGDWILWPPVKEPKKSAVSNEPSDHDTFPWPRPPEPEIEDDEDFD